ncbi:hypothetical protein ADIS_3996 [Lunatimonas lonarensis]|uniref:Collagen-like protein n=1 Tax=Lunatimonas lonarensis TaxID=1232681 RepID=R7ZNG0_9BACT|nr:hypothetical protein [Lunatimonas lonarensis]EON75593.1 hypothetical protein ADIS_3996 [Lunatimonas lonarensis]
MRKILWIAVLLGVTLFPACEGPEGPQGPPGFDGQDGRDGEDGEDGVSFVNLVFEGQVNFADLTEDPAQYVVVSFDVDGFPFEDDNFLVFIQWGVSNGRAVWRLMPQLVVFDQGFLNYNFEFSTETISIFIESNINPASIGPEWTQNQIVRIVYMPGFFAGEGARMDFSDMDTVMKYLGLTEKDVKRITFK